MTKIFDYLHSLQLQEKMPEFTQKDLTSADFLNELKMAELRNIAKKHGIKSAKTKVGIINHILEHFTHYNKISAEVEGTFILTTIIAI